MKYLIDTNVLSELRNGVRADAGVRAWLTEAPAGSLWLSVLTLGELRRGIESIRRRDPVAAETLETWYGRIVSTHADRILPVSEPTADQWGRLNVPDPIPSVDGLIAATALVHGLIVVTRNTRDFARAGVAVLNPFSDTTPPPA